MVISKFFNWCQTLDAHNGLAFLYSERKNVTSNLLRSEPLNCNHYLYRAAIHCGLGYPDLAAGDAYRALTLLETYFDPDFSDFNPELRNNNGELVPWPDDDQAFLEARRDLADCLWCLVLALTELGCLRDAYTYLLQLEQLNKERHFFAEEELQNIHNSILQSQKPESMHVPNNGDLSKEKIEPVGLRNFGLARRETYGWNNHEPDRTSSATLGALNEMLKPVAPNIEVRCVELPILDEPGRTDCFSSRSGAEGSMTEPSCCDRTIKSLQLGLFAKTDLPASSAILHETSVLSAVRPIDASLCHNCGISISEPLSTSSDSLEKPVCCPFCIDAAIFCSPACLDIAQTRYHRTICGIEDLGPLGRDENSKHPSDDLYFLLLARAFAMSHSSNIHPLELPETKYVCGVSERKPHPELPSSRTLPFTFLHNIVLPFRLLSILSEEHQEMSPFSGQRLDWYDTWVVQTLYAKFRGVASARQSTWDGKPEIAAVHPLWCLTNHSCAPNVEWGWDSQRIFRVRNRPVLWGDQIDSLGDDWRGIKEGEEILSHYCDVDLAVKDRREYMLGSLGGECMCERCIWEAGQEKEGEHRR